MNKGFFRPFLGHKARALLFPMEKEIYESFVSMHIVIIFERRLFIIYQDTKIWVLKEIIAIYFR